MLIDVCKYCCDPFKKHGRRIHLNLRVAAASLIAEHPSLFIQSGDLAWVKHCSGVASEEAGPSNLSQECTVRLVFPRLFPPTQD